MQSIDILTFSGQRKEGEDLVKAAEEARSFFPRETWGDIRNLGKITLEYDVNIAAEGKSLGAFLFERLIKRFNAPRDIEGLTSLLLGITADPVVAVYYFFDRTCFKRTPYLIHDYMTDRVGVVSLFRLSQEASAKVVAHGLGHCKGLHHHERPIDLMFPSLLRHPIQLEGFCKSCMEKMDED